MAAVSALREHLARGIVLTAERIQATLDDTVRRGRMTRDDAEDLVQSLVDIGRKQTEDVLADLEQIFGRSGGVAQAARDARRAAADRVGDTAAKARRSQGADRVLREVDRARRATGLGSAFPITAYDSLTATQIAARFDDLSPAQLRKVRDYERRHENRRSVLDAVERRL
jgi:polyhydroxyalkanoate synthesis regulator phasin